MGAPGRCPVTDWATDFDHTDEEYAARAPEIWAQLREECPVAHSGRFGGTWLPTRHADVSAIALSPAGRDNPQAIDFLRFYAGHMPGRTRISLYTDENEPVENYYYAENVKQTLQYIARLENSFSCWANRLGFMESFRISRAESGYPVFQNVLMFGGSSGRRTTPALPCHCSTSTGGSDKLSMMMTRST